MSVRNMALGAIALVAIHSTAALAVDAETLDVAGARLGMSPEQVIDALQKSGWKVAGRPDAYDDFQEEVRTKTGHPRKNTKGIIRAKFIKGDEIIRVKFIALPEGSELFSLQYSFDSPTLAYDDFAQIAIKRYGKPDVVRVQSLSGGGTKFPQSLGWGKFTKDLLRGYQFAGSYLAIGSGNELWLEDNGKRSKRQQAEIQKAVAAMPRAKTSF